MSPNLPETTKPPSRSWEGSDLFFGATQAALTTTELSSTSRSSFLAWIVWLVGVWQFIKVVIKLIRLYQGDRAAWEDIFLGLADDVDCLRRLARDVQRFFSEEEKTSPRERLKAVSRWRD